MPVTHFNFHFIAVDDNSKKKIQLRQKQNAISQATSEIEANLPNNNPRMNAAEILKKGCFLWLKYAIFSIC